MINKNNACTIAKSHLDSSKTYELRVVHGKDLNQRIYGSLDWENSWVVIVNDVNRILSIESSYIVLVHQLSGEVTYSGYANDEG